MNKAFSAAVAATAMVGCAVAASPPSQAAAPAAAAPAPVASAALKDGKGQEMGRARLVGGLNGVLIHVELKGLTPGWHGLHLHEKAACTDAAFQSAGGHINHTTTRPDDKTQHGFLNLSGSQLEFGDLPNIYAGADGMAFAEIFATRVSITGDSDRPALLDADGSSLVVHASPDDYASQPIGGAGARVGCGPVVAGP